MLERIIVFILLNVIFWANTCKNIKKTNRKERITYAVIMIGTIYLGLIFVTEKDWPNLNDLLSYLLLKPAESIMKTFT